MSSNLFGQGNDEKGKIRAWADNFVKEIMLALGLQASTNSIGEDVGKYISSNVAGGIQKNDKSVVKAFNEMFKKLDYQRKFDLISEDEYYQELEILRDKYFAVGTENWIKYTNKIYSYEKKLAEAQKKEIQKLYKEVADIVEKEIDSILKKQEKLQEQLNDVGIPYKKNTAYINGKTYYSYRISDLKDDLDYIKEYSNMMSTLKERASNLGVLESNTDSFFEHVRELNLDDAVGLLKALRRSADGEFSEYINTWNLKSELSQNVAAQQYKDDFYGATSEVYNYMKTELSRAGYEIPENFYSAGELSSQKFGDGFLAGLEEEFSEIRDKINAFNASLGGSGDVTYNTNNTSYNISSTSGEDVVDQIRRYETVKRLSGAGLM